jgi:hypothetical protein
MKTNRTVLFSIVILHFFMMNIAYRLLAHYFEFPEVLRYETLSMLTLFLENKAIIQSTYYLFTLTGITFFVISFYIYESLETKTSLGRLAMAFGCLAGLLTAFGFIRWVFVIPEIAEFASNNQDSSTIVTIVESAIKTIHAYSGVALGENLAFLFQGLWLILLSLDLHFYHTKDMKLILPPALIGVGILTYSLEQFGGVFSYLGIFNVPLQASWLVWLMALSWCLLRLERRKELALTHRETGLFSGLLIVIMLSI